jgi:putative oxidoreductase
MIRSLLIPPPQSARTSAGLLLLRLFAGAAFMVHGWGKIQHPFTWMPAESGASIPGVFQGLAALAEFGGGLAWILGLLTPLASLGLVCTMAVAAWFHLAVAHDALFSSKKGPGAEPAAVYFCVAVLLLLAGPGQFSVDRILFKPKT